MRQQMAAAGQLNGMKNSVLDTLKGAASNPVTLGLLLSSLPLFATDHPFMGALALAAGLFGPQMWGYVNQNVIPQIKQHFQSPQAAPATPGKQPQASAAGQAGQGQAAPTTQPGQAAPTTQPNQAAPTHSTGSSCCPCHTGCRCSGDWPGSDTCGVGSRYQSGYGP
jgi:hypothetical protein